MQCDNTSPDGQGLCPLEAGHTGVHENWHGSWFGGVWFTHFIDTKPTR